MTLSLITNSIYNSALIIHFR